MERHIAIIGSGYIGSAIAEKLAEHSIELHVLSREQTKTEEQIADQISACDFVINAAGFAGQKNIDDCEDHVEITMRDNLDLARMITDASSVTNTRLIHLSTGCVFDGDEFCEFTEDDQPNLLTGVYRQTKILAETFAMRNAHEPISLRIRLPFDGRVHDRNLFSKLSKYSTLVNHKNSVTCVDDLTSLILFIIRKKHFASGIFHATNPHFVTTRDIAEALKLRCAWMNDERLSKLVKIKRSQCVLSAQKLFNHGFFFPYAPHAVEKCAEIYRHAVASRKS